MVKIGHTTGSPHRRAAEFKLKLLAYVLVADSKNAEVEIHERLKQHRPGSYELFELSFQDAKREIENLFGPMVIITH